LRGINPVSFPSKTSPTTNVALTKLSKLNYWPYGMRLKALQ